MVNRLAVLQKSALQLMGHIEPEKMLQEILQQTVGIMGAASGSLSLLEADDSSYVCVSFGVGLDAGRIGVRVKVTDGLIGEVLRTGESVVMQDYQTWEKRIPDPRLDRITTALSAPVKVGGEVIGVIQLAWEDQPVTIEAEDRFVFEQFSHLASIALENVLLFRQLQDDKVMINGLFEGIPGIIYLLDAKGMLVRWNHKLEELSHYSRTELASTNCLDFFRGADVERISQGIAKAIRNGHAEVEAEVYSRNGSRLTYYFTAMPLRIQDKLYIMGIGVDISQRRELEAELRLHRNRLEAVVERRTSQLSAANQELLAMNEEMKVVNEELQTANLQLAREVSLREGKEKEYRAAVRLLTSPAEEAGERIRLILNDALQLVGAPAGYIGFYDEAKNIVDRRCCSGQILFDGMEPQAADKGLMGQVFQTGEAVHVEDYRVFPGRIEDKRFNRFTTIIMAPLKRGNSIKGVLTAHWLDEVHPVHIQDIEVLQQYSDLAAVFLDRMETHAAIRHLAFHDPLTGMANRTSLNLWLEEEMAKVRNDGVQGVLFFIDLDELKIVNDTFGHSIGDDLILTAGNHIRQAFGEDAFCARIGGDEFIVALAGGKSREEVELLADQVVQVLSRDYEVFNERVPMSASVGVVLYPEHGDTADEILKNADSAMYAAKACGRNCWRLYEPSLQKDAYETMMLTNSLRRALERDEITLHYQPKVRLADLSIDGFEALMRWNSVEHGFVNPERFIPLAEKSGVILSLGEWALREACAFARRLADSGRKEQRVAVNISPKQLATTDFIEKIGVILDESGIEPAQLELEVTESILIESMEESINKLEALRKMGVNVALDDFGTGYSSLTYLRRLPVGTLKIDKSFIAGILDDLKQAEYVGFIIDLAHALKLEVVAEGAENQAQVEKLRQYKCDCFQGYVFSPPVPADAAERLLWRKN